MGQRSRSKDAAGKDAQIKLSEEECAKDMGQRLNYAAVKDAQIKSKKEECAGRMGQIAYEDLLYSISSRSSVVNICLFV
jgi:hypothetical protein